MRLNPACLTQDPRLRVVNDAQTVFDPLESSEHSHVVRCVAKAPARMGDLDDLAAECLGHGVHLGWVAVTEVHRRDCSSPAVTGLIPTAGVSSSDSLSGPAAFALVHVGTLAATTHRRWCFWQACGSSRARRRPTTPGRARRVLLWRAPRGFLPRRSLDRRAPLPRGSPRASRPSAPQPTTPARLAPAQG